MRPTYASVSKELTRFYRRTFPMAENEKRTVIDELMEDHRQLMEHLRTTGDISLQIRVEYEFAKTLWVSAASYFEAKLTSDILQIFTDETSGSLALVAFVNDQAIARGYHSWFQWEARNANQFFGKFGPGFRAFMEAKIAGDPSISESIRAFLEIGKIRNPLVHQNYAQFNLGKTVDEVFALYQEATNFVDRIPSDIRQHIQSERATTFIN